MSEPTGRGQRFRHLAKLAFAAIVLAACIVYVEPAKLGQALVSVPAWGLLASLAINIAGTIVVPAAISMVALRLERLRYGFGAMIALNFATRFYILILPRPVAIAVRWVRYRKSGTGADAAALIVFERVVQLVVVVGAALVFLAIERQRLGSAGTYLMIFAAAALLALAGLLAMFVSEPIGRLGSRLFATLGRLTPNAITKRFDQIGEAARAYRSLSLAAVASVVLLSMLGYALFVLSAYVVAVAMDLPLSLMAIAWIRSIVFLATLIPVTVGGIGVRELGNVVLLEMYAIDNATALAYSFALLAVQLAIGVIGGLFEAHRYLRGERDPGSSEPHSS